MFAQFMSDYGTTILYALLTAVAGAVGTWIGTIYKKYINDKTKKDVVNTCVKAVEQLYRDLHGEEKYNKAVESIVEMLGVKGITITDLEIKMLIEATCQEFSKAVNEEIATERTVEGFVVKKEEIDDGNGERHTDDSTEGDRHEGDACEQ